MEASTPLPDVVGLAHLAPGEHRVDGRAVVDDVQPLPAVLGAGVERQRLVVEGERAEVRDQLLGELVRPVVVGAVRDRDRQLVRLGVGAHGMVGPGLRGVVRGARPVGRVLGEGLVGVERQVAVDLAGRDVVEAGHADLAGRLEHGLGPEHVGAEEETGVRARRGELCDSAAKWTIVSISSPRSAFSAAGRVADVALDEDDPVLDVGQVGSVAGIGEHVVGDDMVLGVLFDPVAGEVRPDETGTSRHEKAHKCGHVSPAQAPPS